MAVKDKKHWDMPFPELVKHLDIHHVQSTIERVKHDHHAIFHRQSLEKLHLNDAIEADRVRLAQDGLLIPDSAIIFSDEMWVEFTSKCRKKNQTCKKGDNPYLQADNNDQVDGTIHVIAWAAIVKGFCTPLYIYDPDDILSLEE